MTPLCTDAIEMLLTVIADVQIEMLLVAIAASMCWLRYQDTLKLKPRRKSSAEAKLSVVEMHEEDTSSSATGDEMRITLLPSAYSTQVPCTAVSVPRASSVSFESLRAATYDNHFNASSLVVAREPLTACRQQGVAKELLHPAHAWDLCGALTTVLLNDMLQEQQAAPDRVQMTPELALKPGVAGAPRPERDGPAVPEMLKELYFDHIWEGKKGEIYTFEFSLNSPWKCTRLLKGSTRMFKIRYDENSGLMWWGRDSYFSDSAEVAANPTFIPWYASGDENRDRPQLWRTPGVLLL